MKTAWVTLGRFGDCLNTLPLVLNDYLEGNRPTFVISREWASLLEGVSYCDRLAVDLPYNQPMVARDGCRVSNKFEQIYVPQCYGQPHSFECDSYCQEAWRLAGKLDLWNKLPLVFDRRNRYLEESLIPPNLKKPIVLFNGSGISSPFPHTNLLLELLRPILDRYEVIDLSLVKAPRFFDLLGLYERAEFLITIDSGPLHLAQATPKLKVIALITDVISKWHGSPYRQNHVLRIPYSQFPQRSAEILPVIMGKRPFRFVHVWNDYRRTNAGAIHRHAVAQQTWKLEMTEPDWRHCVVATSQFSRNSQTDFQESRTAPYVTDLINYAVSQCENLNDVIVLTNDDTCVVRGLTQILDDATKDGPVWSARAEHKRFDKPLPNDQVVKGGKHPGADLFAFRVSWWKEYGHEMPDMLLSFEAWDMVLKKLMLITGGKELPMLCYHEIHVPFWTKDRVSAGARHNQNTAFKWFEAHGLNWAEQ